MLFGPQGDWRNSNSFRPFNIVRQFFISTSLMIDRLLEVFLGGLNMGSRWADAEAWEAGQTSGGGCSPQVAKITSNDGTTCAIVRKDGSVDVFGVADHVPEEVRAFCEAHGKPLRDGTLKSAVVLLASLPENMYRGGKSDKDVLGDYGLREEAKNIPAVAEVLAQLRQNYALLMSTPIRGWTKEGHPVRSAWVGDPPQCKLGSTKIYREKPAVYIEYGMAKVAGGELATDFPQKPGWLLETVTAWVKEGQEYRPAKLV